MNSPVDLIDSICDFLRNSTIMNMDLATKKNEERAPQIIAGYLPPKKSEPDPDFPFVIVRLEGFEDNLESAIASIAMEIGTYSKDAQDGWRDVVNIATRIWSELFIKRVVADRYRVEYPCKFILPEEQPFPQWVGMLSTVWTIAHPVEEILEKEVVIDGEFFK
jgi:hypothetical protein